MQFMRPRNPLKPLEQLPTIPGSVKVITKENLMTWCNAKEIIEAANAQASYIIEDAQKTFDNERKRGYQEGENQANIKQAEKMIETVGLTVDYLAQFEHEIIDLVMNSVRKIIYGFDDEDKVIMVARNALSLVRNQKQITLRLHPSQIEIVQARINELLAAFPSVGYIDLLADVRVKAGACILESPVGMIEADLEGQLGALRSAFERILGSRVSA